jgi:hypothetical protein
MKTFNSVDFDTIKDKWIYGYWHLPTAFTWAQKPIKPLFTFRDIDHNQDGIVFLQADYDKESNGFVVDMNSTRWINRSDISIDVEIEDNVIKACQEAEVTYRHNMKKRDVIILLKEKSN